MCQPPMLSAQTNHTVKDRPFGPRWLILVGSILIIVAGLLGDAHPALAQIPVDQLITVDQPAINQARPPDLPPRPPGQNSYTAVPFANPCDPGSFPGCDAPGAALNMSFGVAAGSTNRVLVALEAGGNRFEPATALTLPPVAPDRVVFRRNGPSFGVGGVDRQLLFYEQLGGPPNTPLNLAPSELVELPGRETIGDTMLSPVVNRGIDNVFNNIVLGSEDTRNNIERIDYLIVNGAQVDSNAISLDDVGFLILERGGNDNFGIAAITSLDGAGNPATYGPLVQVDAADWGGQGSIGVELRSAVLRKDGVNPTAPAFRPTHTVDTQSIRGVYLPLSTLLPTAANPVTVFGFSLVAADVAPGTDLVNFAAFPLTTNGTTEGGLDLIAGGFGLVRRVGGFALVKRITNLIGPANLPDFTQVSGSESIINLLQANGLGQGLAVITDPPVTTGNEIEYSIYLGNNDNTATTDILVCDQLPAGTRFNPDAYGTGQGIQAIASSSPAGPVVTYTNADDGDPGRFFAPGEPLPAICGTDQNNGAVVVNVGNINGNQVGLIRFRAIVN